ncbi:MAG: hypothetical protein LBS43_12575, partial [Prevotellaceae bacterium]|nr:hypothetical protein [Prevotellaceae bacterium]
SSDYPAGTNYIAKGREVSGNLSYRLAGTNVTPTLGVSGAAGISFPHENRQPYRTVYKLIRFK